MPSFNWLAGLVGYPAPNLNLCDLLLPARINLLQALAMPNTPYLINPNFELRVMSGIKEQPVELVQAKSADGVKIEELLASQKQTQERFIKAASKLNQEIQKLQTQANQKKREEEGLRKEIERLKREAQERKIKPLTNSGGQKKGSKSKMMATLLQTSTAHVKELEAKLEGSQKDSILKEHTIEEFESKLKKLKETNDALKRKNKELSEQTLIDELAKAKKQIESLQDQLKAFQQVANEDKLLATRLSWQFEDAKKELLQTNSIKLRAEDDRDKHLATVKKLEATIEAMKKVYKENKTRQKETIEELTNKLEELRSQLLKAESEIEEEVRSGKLKRAALEMQFKDFQSEVEEERSEKDRLLEGMRAFNADETEKLAQLRRRTMDLQQQNSILQQQLQESTEGWVHFSSLFSQADQWAKGCVLRIQELEGLLAEAQSSPKTKVPPEHLQEVELYVGNEKRIVSLGELNR